MIQLIILLALLIPILAIVLDSHVGRALAARLERGDEDDARSVLAERVRYLEGEVERLGQEIERLEEESQFLERLLTSRQEGDEPGPLPPGDDDAG